MYVIIIKFCSKSRLSFGKRNTKIIILSLGRIKMNEVTMG